MKPIISIDELTGNILNYLNCELFIEGQFKKNIEGWKGGGIVSNNFTLPVVINNRNIPKDGQSLLCEGCLRSKSEIIRDPMIFKVKCHFRCNNFITGEKLIKTLTTSIRENIDCGFELIIRKLKERKRPKLLLLHPISETSKMDVINTLGELTDKYIIEEDILKYSDEDCVDNLTEAIKNSDSEKYDAICFVSGGNSNGYGILQNERIIETIADLNTPTLGAIGHSDEFHLFDLAFDKSFGTPSQLGMELASYAKNLTSSIIH